MEQMWAEKSKVLPKTLLLGASPEAHRSADFENFLDRERKDSNFIVTQKSIIKYVVWVSCKTRKIRRSYRNEKTKIGRKPYGARLPLFHPRIKRDKNELEEGRLEIPTIVAFFLVLIGKMFVVRA